MTAELVMALPVLVLVCCALAWVLALGASQVRLVDAAREVARGVARGDATSEALEVGRRVAPDDAAFTVSKDGRQVVVRVSVRAGDRGPARALLPDLTLQAEAVAMAEEAP